MAQVHERLHGLELDGERQGVAESAEGVREPVEQVRVLVVGGGADDAAVAGQDLHLDDRLVRHPVAQRSGLDAQPGDRPAEGDRLELRDHQRHQPVPQRRVAQVLVSGHAADPGGAGGPGRCPARDRRRRRPARPRPPRPPGPSGRCRGTGRGSRCAWPGGRESRAAARRRSRAAWPRRPRACRPSCGALHGLDHCQLTGHSWQFIPRPAVTSVFIIQVQLMGVQVVARILVPIGGIPPRSAPARRSTPRRWARIDAVLADWPDSMCSARCARRCGCAPKAARGQQALSKRARPGHRAIRLQAAG